MKDREKLIFHDLSCRGNYYTGYELHSLPINKRLSGFTRLRIPLSLRENISQDILIILFRRLKDCGVKKILQLAKNGIGLL
jgi:hypothetical protein